MRTLDRQIFGIQREEQKVLFYINTLTFNVTHKLEELYFHLGEKRD